MDWLSAHDSNNDGLIEVPEAGDWTDLFGRSYHVLYDEVLWYRANVCFGRLLEYRRDFDRASDYLRWSQQIAGRILASFWPSTRAEPKAGVAAFAERQASQAVVRAELNDDERGLVVGEELRQAREPAGGRLAADARVHDRPRMLRLRDARFEQVHPA